MKLVKQVIFRYLTNADFFNINKPSGTEEGGGGQSYIDFPTSEVSLSGWESFLNSIKNIEVEERAQGSAWKTPIFSLGYSDENFPQSVTIYQRRKNSISIASQKLNSRESNRILAWHPASGFPEPPDPTNNRQLPSGLVIYLVKTEDHQVWAGWFLNDSNTPLPTKTSTAKSVLADMFNNTEIEGYAGLIDIDGNSLWLDPTDPKSPFTSTLKLSKPINARVKTASATPLVKAVKAKPLQSSHSTKTEEEILTALFSEDEDADEPEEVVVQRTIKLRRRNQNAAALLKELYGHTCQITGTKFLFKKSNGTNYTEAHHLIPLGKGGADDPRNIVILSPLVHRMLHYAKVSPINLSSIKNLDLSFIIPSNIPFNFSDNFSCI